MKTWISHINLFVRDQQVAYDVYVGKLGFKVNTDVRMDNGMRWLTVTPPGNPDIELLLAEPRSPMMTDDVARHIREVLEADAMPGGVWNTDDCRKAFAEMKAKGFRFLKEPKEEFYGTEALFLDGCGNWYSLTERKPGA